jgi:hypothetical protein
MLSDTFSILMLSVTMLSPVVTCAVVPFDTMAEELPLHWCSLKVFFKLCVKMECLKAANTLAYYTREPLLKGKDQYD